MLDTGAAWVCAETAARSPLTTIGIGKNDIKNPTVAGVDVGGATKGFHAVALRNNCIVAMLATSSAEDLAAWCGEQGVFAVGIDAPCRWSLGGRARPCERALAGSGISSFSTPSQAVGKAHPFYRWMVNGAKLFQLLAPQYRLYDGRSPLLDPLCFETFPQAIACGLAGKLLLARHKRVDRRRLLENAGIATAVLGNIDEIDAALCALAAQHVLAGTFKALGDAAEGFILLPGR
jgi:predicted nuclease with RNAse H fold